MRTLLKPTAACMSESGDWMVASRSNDALVYDVRCFDGPAVLQLHTPNILCDGGLLRDSSPMGSAISPDARYFAVAYSNRAVCFDLLAGCLCSMYRGTPGYVLNAVRFCTCGRFILVPPHMQ